MLGHEQKKKNPQNLVGDRSKEAVMEFICKVEKFSFGQCKAKLIMQLVA